MARKAAPASGKKAGKPGNILRLDRITHRRIRDLDRSRTLVAAAMSPIEVHGPHLPLGQDLFQACALTESTLERLANKRPDWTFVLLPPVPIATDCVPKIGSLSFPVSLVRDVAYHLLRPFALHGFARLVFTNFHGGPRHNVALEAAATRLSREFGAACISVMSAALGRILQGDLFFQGIEHTPGRRIGPEQIKQDMHAGHVETSIALHLWPELVEDGWQDLPESVPQAAAPGRKASDHFLFSTETADTLTGRVRRSVERFQTMADSVRHFRENTYKGYPALSSAREGRDLFEHLIGISEQVMEEFLNRGREMDGHSPLWALRKVLLNPAVNKVFDDWLGVYSE